MKNSILYIILFASLLACSKESSLKLELSDEILSYRPSYNSAPLFSSNGDTIQLDVQSSERYFYEKGNLDGSFGPYEGIDRLLEERAEYILASDSLGLTFNFRIAAIYTPSAPALHNDFLLLNFNDSLNELIPELSIGYDGDTSFFLLNNTYYRDSLKINDRYFYNVLAQENPSGMAVYINNTGLLGFRTSTNRTFQIVN